MTILSLGVARTLVRGDHDPIDNIIARREAHNTLIAARD